MFYVELDSDEWFNIKFSFCLMRLMCLGEKDMVSSSFFSLLISQWRKGRLFGSTHSWTVSFQNRGSRTLLEVGDAANKARGWMRPNAVPAVKVNYVIAPRPLAAPALWFLIPIRHNDGWFHIPGIFGLIWMIKEKEIYVPDTCQLAIIIADICIMSFPKNLKALCLWKSTPDRE